MNSLGHSRPVTGLLYLLQSHTTRQCNKSSDKFRLTSSHPQKTETRLIVLWSCVLTVLSRNTQGCFHPHGQNNITISSSGYVRTDCCSVLTFTTQHTNAPGTSVPVFKPDYRDQCTDQTVLLPSTKFTSSELQSSIEQDSSSI